MDGQEIKANLRKAISDLCRWRVSENSCSPDECDFCPVNEAYDMARETEQEESDEY